jgi:predicted kinase
MVKGNYCFNPARLGEAHAQCLRRFLGAVSRKENVVVDNTNTSLLELAPYVSLAQAYRYDLELIYVECSPELSAARNTHGVPAETVGKMHRALQETLKSIPPWWPQVKVIPQGSF